MISCNQDVITMNGANGQMDVDMCKCSEIKYMQKIPNDHICLYPPLKEKQ